MFDKEICPVNDLDWFVELKQASTDRVLTVVPDEDAQDVTVYRAPRGETTFPMTEVIEIPNYLMKRD